ncbi:YgaP-like transmembrane domain [Aureibaculum luteum]|uniref:YgaP-like transmembrane domain n=1 Tax=Aureibaculum luteum TaxID=1548456 RepID=UPI000E540D7E|nr:YgaP-like transmembrane domain [Aureibaculum luteum]
MTKNLGKIDRIIRIIIFIVMTTLYFSKTVTGTIGLILLLLGGIALLSSLVSFSPVYEIFGISTYKDKKLK